MNKFVKDNIEFSLALLGFIGMILNYFSFKTFVILSMSSFGLFFLTYHKIWIYTKMDSAFSKIAYFVKRYSIIVFIFFSFSIILTNIGKKYLPDEINNFVSFHFIEPNELVELKSEKLEESKFVNYTNIQNEVLKTASKNPRVIVKGSDNNYISFSFLFLSRESMQYLFNTTFNIMFYPLVIIYILIFGMFIADKINDKFTAEKR